ncbi:MAG TPA: hypothetical protein VLI72_18540 [Methylibium sp.]|nr:hypothetical protein [Methylibium sp.]
MVAWMVWGGAGGAALAAVPAQAALPQRPADVRVALALPYEIEPRGVAPAPAVWLRSDDRDGQEAPMPGAKRLALLAAGIGVIVFLTRRRLDD